MALVLLNLKAKLSGKNYKGLYRCGCGVEFLAFNNNVKRDKTNFCDRCRAKNISKRMSGNLAGLSHGMADTREYHTWEMMIQRCTNPRATKYSNYGRRGVTVCPEWLNSFQTFYSDMGPRPKGRTLDRIDNDKGYFKENCRWATVSEQNRNKRK